MNPPIRWLVAVILVCNLISARAAGAAEAPAAEKSGLMNWLEGTYITGDWGGVRSDLAERGVNFEFFYIATNPRNISGGIKTGSSYQGAMLMLLDVESKLVGYQGGRFHAAGVSLHGHGHFSDQHIGDLNKVNLVDFPNAWRLWELWYEHKFANDRVSLKFGQMAVDQDFLMAEYYNSLASINFLNQTFFFPTLAFNVYDLPGFPVGRHALASSPYGAPGIRLKVNVTDQVYAQVGAYDGLPDQKNGTYVNINEAEGALIYAEIGYRLNQRPESTGLPGNIKLTAFYHTDDYPDNRSVMFGAPTFHSGTYGGFLLIDQVLFREIGKDDPAQQGMVGFFRVGGAPPDRNLTQFGIDGGLVYKGAIPGRDWDAIGLAGSFLQMSDDLRQAQKDVNELFPGTFPFLVDYEAAVELSYKAQITAWCTLHLSLQRAIHPGGSPQNDDAWALIFGSTLRF